MSTGTARPLAAMKPIADCFVDRVGPACERIELAGSLRRRRPQIGDIEIVAIPRWERRVRVETKAGDLFGPDTKVEHVEKINLAWERCDELADTASFTKRGERYRQFTFAGAKVDFFQCDAENWGWILLIRTGSADFSHWMAGELNTAGYCSEEGRIHRHDGTRARNAQGPAISTPDEREVFRLAGHMVIDPTKREASPGVRRRT